MTKEMFKTLNDSIEAAFSEAVGKAVDKLNNTPYDDIGSDETLKLVEIIQRLRSDLSFSMWEARPVNQDSEPRIVDLSTTGSPNLPTELTTSTGSAPETPQVVTTTTAEPEAPRVYQKEEVRNVLLGLKNRFPDDEDIIKNLLSEFGCAKLSDVPEAQYAALIEKAQEKAGMS